MIKILTFGTFDLLHEGHISYLKQAKELGSELYVLVACDEAVKWAKKRLPEESAEKRLAQVEKLPFVDRAWIGEPVSKVSDYLRPILEIKPDIICLGYDQALKEEKWLRDELKKLKPSPKLARLESFKPEIYKTSLLRNSKKSFPKRNKG